MNRYNDVFFRIVTSLHVHIHDDYLPVLDVLRADKEAKDERFSEELRKAGLLPES